MVRITEVERILTYQSHTLRPALSTDEGPLVVYPKLMNYTSR